MLSGGGDSVGEAPAPSSLFDDFCLRAADRQRRLGIAAELAEQLQADVAAQMAAEVWREATWRVRPKRSPEAKQRRRQKAKQRKRKSASGGGGGDGETDGGEAGDGDSGGGHGSGSGGGTEPAAAPDAETLLTELRAAKRALKDRSEVLALTRKQLRRETKTSKARWQQLARRGTKASKKLSRKLFAKQARDVAGAARREQSRARKRKLPPLS